jgi:6-phosphofructokinase 1
VAIAAQRVAGNRSGRCRIAGVERAVENHDNLAILVGGRPVPGINAVIGAVTIRARLEGLTVLGIRNGFDRIMVADVNHVTPLTIESVSRIHLRGGSQIGISEADPTINQGCLDTVLLSLLRLNVTRLVTIGDGNTAYAAMQLHARAAGRIRAAHVPATIDGDLDLPSAVETLGFQSVRHYGVEIVKNLMVDAKTTSRWYVVMAMGSKAGHFALASGNAVRATMTLVPEEFTEPCRRHAVVDTLVGSIIKRLSRGRRDGVAVIGERVVCQEASDDLTGVSDEEQAARGDGDITGAHPVEILRAAIIKRLTDLGMNADIVAKTIGYELRCADPIPYDMEYARDLGCCAVGHVMTAGPGAVISMQSGSFVPIPFPELIDAETGRPRRRRVDIHSARYRIARAYMIRLRRDDFDDPHDLAKLAATAGLSHDDFRRQFEYLVHGEPPPLASAPGGSAARVDPVVALRRE